MRRNFVIAFIGCVVILLTSLCWAEGPPFPKVLRDLKDHAGAVRTETQEFEKLANRLRGLAVEIEELSNTINYPDQKEKISRLEAKANRLREWVAELEYKTDALRDLAVKVQQESRIIARKPQESAAKCEPGTVWIPRHKAPGGNLVPGHCAPSE